MVSRCERKYILPVFRALVAKELVNTYHLTQVNTAKKLGTTQAAISQYLSSKRAIKRNEQIVNRLHKIQAIAAEAANHLASNQANWEEVTRDFCRLCSTFLIAEENLADDDYSI